MINTNQWYEVSSRYHGFDDETVVAEDKSVTPLVEFAFLESCDAEWEELFLSIVMRLEEIVHRECERGTGKAKGAIGLAPSIAPSDRIV